MLSDGWWPKYTVFHSWAQIVERINRFKIQNYNISNPTSVQRYRIERMRKKQYRHPTSGLHHQKMSTNGPTLYLLKLTGFPPAKCGVIFLLTSTWSSLENKNSCMRTAQSKFCPKFIYFVTGFDSSRWAVTRYETYRVLSSQGSVTDDWTYGRIDTVYHLRDLPCFK